MHQAATALRVYVVALICTSLTTTVFSHSGILCQLVLQIREDIGGACQRTVAVFIHDPFPLEVPLWFDLVPPPWPVLEIVRGAHDQKIGRTVLSGEFLHLGIGRQLLPPELLSGERKERNRIAKFVAEIAKQLVLLLGETSC
eukprot:TRINITY_DN549_c0_g1_i3.p1 TRINITY_DN549_c0_g1~~TRINITY_DN549_c0_g1_i3.p1  ORF type:complete len:142 (+),score=4.93 TRINITY_DN549_c0_g1_i3:240-665(+)